MKQIKKDHLFSKYRLSFCLIFAFIFLIFPHSFSFGSLKKENKENVKAALLPEKFIAQFEQDYESALSGKKKSHQGMIKYLYPGHLWLEVVRPEKEKTLFVSNNEKSWFYTPPFDENEPGEVIVRPANKLLFSHFLDILIHGLKDNDFYHVKGNGLRYQLIFKSQAQKDLGVKEADLTFKTPEEKTSPLQLENLVTMSITYSDKKIVKFSFSDFKTNINLQKEDFVFKVQEKVKVIEQN